MNGIRFYEEYPTTYAKRKRRTSGTVFAAFVCNGQTRGPDSSYEGLGAVYDRPNSPVCGCMASLAYLRDHCRRISEHRARALHPALFAVLDKAEPEHERSKRQ